MTHLKDTTFITVIKAESEDRIRNVRTVFSFLNHHFKTRVLVYNICDKGKNAIQFIEDFENLDIRIFEDNSNPRFHRTKFLNYLLSRVETKVTCNYDIDVVFEPTNYSKCEKDIINDTFDFVYPYSEGEFQIVVPESFDRTEFEMNFNLDLLKNIPDTEIRRAYCGFAVFVGTDFYRASGGENEKFISYGPEDMERLYRFYKLGGRMGRILQGTVHHFEHYRGIDSGRQNPFFLFNDIEFETIKNLTEGQIRERVPEIKKI